MSKTVWRWATGRNRYRRGICQRKFRCGSRGGIVSTRFCSCPPCLCGRASCSNTATSGSGVANLGGAPVTLGISRVAEVIFGLSNFDLCVAAARTRPCLGLVYPAAEMKCCSLPNNLECDSYIYIHMVWNSCPDRPGHLDRPDLANMGSCLAAPTMGTPGAGGQDDRPSRTRCQIHTIF